MILCAARRAALSVRLAATFSSCHEGHMIEFRQLPDDHPDLAHSPMLRAALLTLQYAHEHGSIGLTETKAFKRVFVHWAVEHFDWPGTFMVYALFMALALVTVQAFQFIAHQRSLDRLEEDHLATLPPDLGGPLVPR